MIITVFLLLISIVTLPWWVSTGVALVLALFRGSLPFLIIAGFIVDTWYGYPIQSLYGFSYLYTLIFGLFGLTSFIIRTRVIE